MISPRFVFTFLTLSIATFLPALALGQQTSQISKMYGEITLMSNYIEKGLTQSDKNPSIGAELGYGFGGQGRIGLVAHSISFPGEDASVSIRLYGEYKFIFGPNSDLKLRNDWVRYFSDGQRNNVLIKLDQNFFSYHILFEYEDNFNGTKTRRNWVAFRKDWPFSGTYQFNLTAGYSMLEVDGLNNYFDTKAGVSYVSDNLSAGIFNTYNSEGSQFGEQGDMAFLIEIVAKF